MARVISVFGGEREQHSNGEFFQLYNSHEQNIYLQILHNHEGINNHVLGYLKQGSRKREKLPIGNIRSISKWPWMHIPLFFTDDHSKRDDS